MNPKAVPFPHTFVLSLLIAAIPWSPSQAANLHGRVTDQTSGHGIEGAQVTLDPLVTDGTPEFETETGPFGYYVLDDVPAGSYELELSHPAYIPLTEDLVLAGEATVTRADALTPLALPPGSSFFDIYVRVSGVSTDLPLENVPVRFWRFASSSGGSAQEDRTVLTDAEGYAVIRGERSGHYEFRVNEPSDAPLGITVPKWQRLPKASAGQSTARQEINGPQQLNVKLLPIAESMTIHVCGFDPITQMTDKDLPDHYVDLFGVTAADPAAKVVLPVRSGVTNANGKVTFNKLPNIVYKVEVKRLGYEPVCAFIDPADHGDCLPDVYKVNANLHPTHLFATALHPYAEEDLFNLLNFNLTGLESTNTDGIQRTVQFYGLEGFKASRVFSNLLPGRYLLSVEGQPLVGVNGVGPYFRGSRTVEIALGDPVYGGFQSEAAELPLETVKAKVRGRVYIANESATFNGIDGAALPVYQPAANMEFELVETLGNPLLPPALQTIPFTTDSKGGFALEVYPSRYGIRSKLPMPDHTSSQIRLQNFTTAIPSEQEIVQRWAYVEREPDATDGSFHLRSGDDYHLDIHIARQWWTVAGTIFVPGSVAVPHDLERGGGQVTLTDNSGANPPRTVPMTFADVHGFGAAYRFDDVPPGDYTLMADHSRFTFEYSAIGGPSATLPSITLPALVPVGTPPPAAEAEAFTEIRQDIIATYTQPDTALKRRINTWNPNTDEYEMGAAINLSGFVTEADYAAPLRSGSMIPQGGFSFWAPINAGGIQGVLMSRVSAGETGEIIYEIYKDGPDNNNAGRKGQMPEPLLTNIPLRPLSTTIRVYNLGDPGTLVTGDTTMVFTDSNNQMQTIVVPEGGSAQLSNFASSPQPDGGSVVNDFWEYVKTDVTLLDPDSYTWETKVYMKRTVKVQGTVLQSGPTEVPKVQVQVLNRWGSVIRSARTDVGGKYDFLLPLPNATPIFLDFTAPGYEGYRERKTAEEGTSVAGDPGASILDTTVLLESLPLPQVTEKTLDRFGLFIPGVSRQGSQSPGTYVVANDALTLTWTCRATAQSFTEEIQPFDDRTGQEQPVEPQTIVDPIKEIWIMDPRSYLGSPVTADPMPIPLPNNDRPFEKTKFLKDLDSGTYPNVFIQKITALNYVEDEATATGQITLWDLPKGEFHPVFIIITERGAVQLSSYTYPAGKTPLTGAETTPTLALISDFAATVAGVLQTNQTINDLGIDGLRGQDLNVGNFFSRGRFEARPQFTATIALDDMHPGYVNYAWKLGIDINESQAVPDKGFASFGPGMAGLSLFGEAAINVRGKAQEIAFSVKGEATTADEIEVGKYFPSKFKGFKIEKPKIRPGISMKTEFADILGVNHPLEAQLRHTVVGAVTMRTSAEITPLAYTVPYAGPIIRKLNKYADVVSLNADASGALYMKSRLTWTTERPKALEEGQSSVTVHRPRRHLLGGEEASTLATIPQDKGNSVELGFNLGTGLSFRAGVAKVRAGVALVGEERRFPGLPDPIRVASVEFNDNGAWPYLKRLQGALNLNASANVDIGLVSLGKSWDWDAITLDIELNTEPVFQLVPMQISQTIEVPGNTGPATDYGLAPQLASGLSEQAPFQVRSALDGSEGLLAYVDYDASSSGARLRVAQPIGSGAWAAAQTIHTTGAIVDLQILPLPPASSNTWMLVWTEMPASAIDDAFPSLSLYSALSNDGGATWSAPNQIRDAGTWLESPKLVTAPGLTGVIFLESASFLSPEDRAILACKWNGVSWSAAETVRPAGAVQTMDAIGGKITGNTGMNGYAVIGYIDAANDVWAQPWGIAGLPAATDIGDGSHQIAFGGTDDDIFASWTDASGFPALARNDADDTWTALGSITEASTVDDLGLAYLDHATEPVLVLGWTSGGAVRSVTSAFVSLAGGLLTSPFDHTANERGAYDALHLEPLANRTIRLTTRYTASPSEIRTFTVQYPNITSLEDKDTDGLQDLAELWLIDHDQTDVFTMISDVSPTGDFDNDGFTNGDEIAAGSDPANPFSIPTAEVIGAGLELATLKLLPNGDVQVTVAAEPGGRYHLEVSTDLHGYERIASEPGLAGILQFDLPLEESDIRHFFRVIRED